MEPMKQFLAFIMAAVIVAYVAVEWLHVDFWVKPAEEKLSLLWERDLHEAAQENHLPKEWQEISEVSIESPDPRVTEWLESVRAPIEINENGEYLLNVTVIHWVEGRKYGVILQYELFHKPTENKVLEFGRTLHLGYVL